MTDAAGPRPLRVKICGLTRLEDAVAAAAAGADYLGFIASDGFPRSVSAAVGAAFGRETELPVVAVVVDEPTDRVVELAGAAGATVVQLHGDESPGELVALRGRGAWKLWKALRVRTGEDVADGIRRYGPVADGLLLDGWHPTMAGGSGTRFPWEVVGQVRGAFPPGLDFIAAGGLHPGDVAEAVERMGPDVVDVSSGVETSPGVKDPARIRSFIENAKCARR